MTLLTQKLPETVTEVLKKQREVCRNQKTYRKSVMRHQRKHRPENGTKKPGKEANQDETDEIKEQNTTIIIYGSNAEKARQKIIAVLRAEK